VIRFFNFLEAHNGLVTALGTFVIAIFTVILALATIELKKLGEQQANSSITQLRAYVFLDKDQIAENLRVAVGEVPAGMFRFNNFGLTPANNLLVHINSGVGPWPLPENAKLPLPTQTKGTQVAPPGAVTLWPLEPQGRPVPAEDFEEIKGGNAHFYVWGRATYTDVFGKDRFTNFCLAVVPPTDPRSGSGYGFIRCRIHNDYN
jgi:hypothetical protein